MTYLNGKIVNEMLQILLNEAVAFIW